MTLQQLTSYSTQDVLDIAFKKRESIMSPWLLSGTFNMLHAYRGIGKTFFALQTAFMASAGCEWGGWVPDRAFKVLYIDGEMGMESMQSRLKTIESSNPFVETNRQNLRILCPELMGNKAWRINDPKSHAKYKADLEWADFIVFDNLLSLMRFESYKENIFTEWPKIETWMVELTHIQKKCVLLIHHDSKRKDMAGPSSIETAMDHIIHLKKARSYGDAKGIEMELHFTKTRHIESRDATSLYVNFDRNAWKFLDIQQYVRDTINELLNLGVSETGIQSMMNISQIEYKKAMET